MDKNVRQALNILFSLDVSKEPGHYEVSEDISYNIEEYETRDKELCQYESHQKHVDIQRMLEGEEMIYVIPSERLEIKEKLSEERDVIFYKDGDDGEVKLLKKGDLLILYPGDAHKAGVYAGGERRVKKAVFKVQLSE